MLRLDDEKKPVNSSDAVSPVITYAEISNVISNYTSLNKRIAKTFFEKYISDRKESEVIRQLRTASLFSHPENESSALDQASLFKLALLLAPTLKSKDSILTEAIKPIIEKLGKTRIAVSTRLAKKNPKRAAELFDSLLRIPDSRVSIVAGIYACENDKFTASPETIELFVKHSDRCEMILNEFKSLTKKQRKEKISKLFDKLYLDELSLLSIMKLLDANYPWMDPASPNVFLNQIIAAVLKHDEHMVEAVYALVWLENHGINTKENENIINERPADLSSLPKIGFFPGKKRDIEFNQKLFQFALNEGAKKESKTEDAIAMEIPPLTRALSK